MDQDKGLFAGVLEACKRLGYTVEPEPDFDTGLWARICWGPILNCGFIREERRLFAPAKAMAGDADLSAALGLLHELGHLVFWHPTDGVNVDETWFMPWEVGVVRTILGSDGWYWQHPYTQMTTVMDRQSQRPLEVAHWRSPKRSRWYREGVTIATRMGAIDRNGMPTWELPDWRALDQHVAEHSGRKLYSRETGTSPAL